MPERASCGETRQAKNECGALGGSRQPRRAGRWDCLHRDRLIVRLKRVYAEEASDRPDDRLLTIPWHKPPSKRSRQILLPHNASRSDVRPEQFERRARLVSAIARGRRWLDDVVSGRVTTVAQLCTREKCSVRQVN